MSRRLLMVVSVASLAWSGCAGGAIRPASTSVATDDATITARVKTMLLNDPQVSAKIDVSTVNGVVTLSGSVRSKAEEARAIEIAGQVSGVTDVRSTLQVAGGATTLRF